MAKVLPLFDFIIILAFARFLMLLYSLMVTVPLIIGSDEEPFFLVFELVILVVVCVFMAGLLL